MNLYSLKAMMDELAAQDSWSGLLLELAARGTLVLLIALLLAGLARRFPAAWRHLVWHGGITALLLLPLFMGLPPLLEIPLSAPAVSVAAPEPALLAGTAVEGTFPGPWLPLLWGAPAAALILYILLGLLRAALVTRAAPPAGDVARAVLDALLAETGDGRAVDLRGSASVRTPASWGLFEPVILLPEASRDWPESRLRHVLMHELAHIGRLDWLSQLLARLACALYWYNPLVWLTARRLAEEAECACDDAVLLHGQAGGDYAGNLLAIARQAGVRGRAALFVQAMADSFLGRRLAAILDDGIRRDASEGIYLVRGLLASLPLLAAVATAELVPAPALPAMNGTLLHLIPVNLGAADGPRRGGGVSREGAPPPARPVASAALPVPGDGDGGVPRARGDNGLLPGALLGTGRVEGLVLPELDGTVGVARALRPLSTPLPDYPEHALQTGLEGFALVEYEVDAAGAVTGARVLDSRPGAVFDRASLKAVLDYRYQPQLVGGEAVGVEGLRTRFVFKLRPAPD